MLMMTTDLQNIDLEDFEFKGKAEDIFERFYSADLLDELDSALQDMYPDGIYEDELNDLLANAPLETIAEWCNIESKSNVQNNIDEIETQMENLENQYDDNKISENEFHNKINPLYEELTLLKKYLAFWKF